MPAQSERPPVVVNCSCPALIVLSAKTGDRLREQALQLVAALERRSLGDADLADVAYTLQVGREAMESRLALTASSLAELTSKLKGYLSGKSGIEEFYQGEIKRGTEMLAVAADEDMAQTIDAWVAKGKYGKLLELWVKGLSFDWRRLYGEARPRRISLPTYPFARERYWAEPARLAGAAANGSGAGMLHPVLHRDASARSGLRFGARLSGTEGYLRVVPGSRVPGARVLPDVGQLELARAAVAAAAGADATEVELEQVEWLCPVEVGADGLELRVELFAEGAGRSGYEITSIGADGAGVVHSQGIAVVATVVGSAGEGVFEERAVEGVGTLLARRDWRAGEVGASATGARAPGEHVVLLCAAGAERVAAIEAEVRSALPHARCVVVGRGAEGIGGRYETSVRQVLELLQQIMRAKPKEEVLIQAVVGVSGEDALPCGLSGLLKTAGQEHPKLKGQVIGIDAGASAAEIVARLEASAGSPDEREVRYIGGERQVASWSELRSEEAPAPWRDGGVYLITGGAGGLGLIFAEAIARGAKAAVIVLTGRSELDERRRARLSAIEGLGARVEYRVVDVADGAAVTALIGSVRESHGGLTGILHAAGVIRDSFLLKKTAEEAQAVLAPKVAGVLNLDEATRELTLEFMALFGSGSGAFGNVGQADYAAANAFLGGYAAYRNGRVSRGERWGRTVSIAWPLWRDGGMQLAEAASRQQQEAGLVPLATVDGLQAFYRALAADADEVLVLSGQEAALRAQLAPADGAPAQQPRQSARSGSRWSRKS